MAFPASIFSLRDEQAALRTSVSMTVVIAALGIGFGLFSGSFSIAFDGMYSLLDAAMSLLSLFVVGLITAHTVSRSLSRRLQERFTMGFWHLEPMMLGLNGITQITAAVYAFITAVGSILSGGRTLEFGWAVVYALVTCIACSGMAWFEHRANQRMQSDFIRLDIKGWVMSAGISAALLIAFSLGYAVQGTQWVWLSPYIDPAVLAVICLLIIPLPIATVKQALADVFLVTPSDLKLHIDTVAQAFVNKYKFMTHRAYVARVGRAKQIELYFIVPAESENRSVADWDAIRDEVSDAIGEDGPHRWLTVVFTADIEWAEGTPATVGG